MYPLGCTCGSGEEGVGLGRLCVYKDMQKRLPDHDQSAPIEATGAWSDDNGTHAARRTALRERVDSSMFDTVIASM